MAKISVGIDIGTYHTKIVSLRKEESEYHLLAYGILPTKTNNDKILKFIKRTANTTSDVRINIETPSLRIRRQDLPTTKEEEISEAIKWSSMKIIDGDVDDYEFQYSIIHQNDLNIPDKTSVVIYAIKKSDLQTVYNLLSQASLPRPTVIEPNTSALRNSFLHSMNLNDTKRAVILEIGHTQALFAVVSKYGLLFSRPLASVAEKNLNEQIMRDLHLDENNALTIKTSYLKGIKESNLIPSKTILLKNTINHYYSRLALELQRSIDNYMLAFERRKVDEIYICGGGSYKKDLSNYLAKTLGIVVKQFNPFDKINTSQFPLEQLAKKQSLFAVACGLSLD